MFQTSTVLSKATSIVCRERRWLFRACVVDRYCTRMGYTIAFLFSLLFQLIPNKFWSSLLLEHLVSCSCFRVLIVSCGFIDGQIEHRTFYGSGIFALFSSQKVPSRRIWEALPTPPFLAARKYQAVGYGKPYLRIALHLMARCLCTESLHVQYVLELMETGLMSLFCPLEIHLPL